MLMTLLRAAKVWSGMTTPERRFLFITLQPKVITRCADQMHTRKVTYNPINFGAIEKMPTGSVPDTKVSYHDLKQHQTHELASK